MKNSLLDLKSKLLMIPGCRWLIATILAIGVLTIAILLSMNNLNDPINACDSIDTNRGLETVETTFLTNNPIRFFTELANTPHSRSQGLMCTADLGSNEGMIFIFDSPTQLNFWMKNTLIPLDIIFVDETNTITTIHENALPLREDLTYPSNGPAIIAIEINGGLARKNNIKVGDKISFE